MKLPLILNAALLLILTLFSGNNFAQTTQHWSISNGLPSNIVNEALQDDDGFIWFATTNGLIRNNGYSFDHFNQSVLDNLCSVDISAICFSDNKLWIGSVNHGISVLDLDTYTIVRNYSKKEKKFWLPSNQINEIIEDKHGVIWVSTWNGSIGWLNTSNQFEWLTDEWGKTVNIGSNTALASDPQFIYAVSTNGKRYKIDPKTHRYESLQPDVESSEHIRIVVPDPKSGALFCSPKGIVRNGKKLQAHSAVSLVENEEVFYMLKDRTNGYWVVQHDRRKLTYIKDGQKLDFTDRVFDFQNNVHINHIFEDASQNIWLSTTNGVYCLSNEARLFSSILSKSQVDDPNYIPSFRGMAEDSDGTIYFGGYSGLYKLKKSGKLNQVFGNEVPYSPYRIINKNKEELWVISEGFGLLSVNKESGKVIVHDNNLHVSSGKKGLYLQAGILSQDGDFWLSSYMEILRFDPETNQYYKPKIHYKGHSIDSYSCREIYERSDGQIWLGTSLGVFVLDKKGTPIAHFHSKASGKFRIPFDDINAIRQLKDGTMILGSRTKGIALLSESGTKAITVNEQLTDNGVAAIEEDERGIIWISTNHGVSAFNPKTNKILNFYEENGLSDNEFNHASSFVSSNGELFFGGINGINIFQGNSSYSSKSKNARLKVSKLEFNGEGGAKNNYFNGAILSKGIVLPFDQTFVYFEFFLDDYLRPDLHRYFYSIEGKTNGWKPLKGNTLQLTAMSSGSYTVRIRSVSSSGVAAMNELEIPITIQTVFYKTLWFWGTILLFAIALTSYILYLRIQKKRSLVGMRSEIAANLHDDLGSVLTKIAMQAEIMEEDSESGLKSLAQSISGSSRNAVSTMRDVIWSIDSRNSKVENLFDKVNEYLYEMLDGTDIDYTIQLDPSLKSIRLSPIQKRELFFILKESINNALKHGSGEWINVSINGTKDSIELRVSNSIHSDGRIDKVSAGSGLKNMKQRAAVLKAEIDVNTGDHFSIMIKFKKERNLFKLWR